jgi:hypothetical protein
MKSGVPLVPTKNKIDHFVSRRMSSDWKLGLKEHSKQVRKETKEEQEGECKVSWKERERGNRGEGQPWNENEVADIRFFGQKKGDVWRWFTAHKGDPREEVPVFFKKKKCLFHQKKFSTFLLTANNNYFIFLFSEDKIGANRNYRGTEIKTSCVENAKKKKIL